MTQKIVCMIAEVTDKAEQGGKLPGSGRPAHRILTWNQEVRLIRTKQDNTGSQKRKGGVSK